MGPHPAVARARSCVRQGLAGLEPGDLVLAACSGGGDSLALAAALAHEAPRLGLRGGGVTVDHGLQDGSAARASRVAAMLRQLGLDPVHQVSVTVPAGPGRGGPEAAARAARYAALEQVAEQAGAAAVLLGHTLDDQAETVLLGLARGAGGRALAGMPARRGRFRRPLLGTARATLREACAAQHLETWDDPHNADPAYTRARVRHQALPALEAALGPGVAVALARSAAQLSADCDALDAIAAAEAWRMEPAPAGRNGADGSGHVLSVMDIEGLAGLATAVRSRVLRQAALAAGCPAGSLAARHIAALDALVTGWHGQRWADLPGMIRAQRRYGKLLFSKGRPAGAGPPGRTEAEAAGGRE
ncbi:MAG TPA: tRNA lysidine(34) synthetase TilS [Streptosporangiaceae bacterium]|nr:tRNA lysidine(34) synthetase TilS [Streptosporangiaceae bacterium]